VAGVKAAICTGILALAVLLSAGADARIQAFPGGNGKLVFVSDRAPNLQNDELYIVGSDGRGAAPLAGVTSTADEFDPAWSPDGRRLAFAGTRTDDTEIFVRDETGAVTQLTHSPGVDRFPTWSADGRRIAFASERRGTGASEIYVVDAVDGSELARVTTNETTPSPNPNIPRPGDLEPAWSPDGSLIAYARVGSPGSGIRVVHPDGSSDRSLTSIGGPTSTEEDRAPAWSPDSGRLAFGRGAVLDPASAIWLMNADGSDARALTGGSRFESSPAWSPDGQSIAFVSGPELAVLRLDGGGMRVVARDAAGRPAWAPDGRRLVYTSWIQHGPFRLYTIDLKGRVTRLGTDQTVAAGLYPAWSPDGSKVAFVTEFGRLVVIRADGSHRRVLTRFSVQKGPAWSPGGSRIAFARRGDLFSIRSGGGGLRRLTATRRAEGEPTWSPDGRTIAFTAGGGIWTMRADGKDVRKLPGAIGSSPAWSPDGRRIAFTSGRTPGFFNPELWIMNADGSRQHRILKASSTDGRVWSDRFPTWSPDGRWIAFSSNVGAGIANELLFVVHPDGSAKTQVTPNTRAVNLYPDWQPVRRR
jgi:Tol biopolymer transport system component